MLIRVMYHNRRYDMVKDFFLQNLIASGRINRFYRADGWAEIGRDPLRGSGTHSHTGPERREHVIHRPLDTLIHIGENRYRPHFPGRFDLEIS